MKQGGEEGEEKKKVVERGKKEGLKKKREIRPNYWAVRGGRP